MSSDQVAESKNSEDTSQKLFESGCNEIFQDSGDETFLIERPMPSRIPSSNEHQLQIENEASHSQNVCYRSSSTGFVKGSFIFQRQMINGFSVAEASQPKLKECLMLGQNVDFGLKSNPPAAFDEESAKNTTKFQCEEVDKDTQKNMIYMKQQIAYLTEEIERSRIKENLSNRILVKQIKEIEQLTTANTYLTDVIVDLKRKIEAFEQKSEKLDSRHINQSVYDMMSVIQTKLQQNEVNELRTTNMQQEINSLKTELIKTNLCTETCRSEVEKLRRKCFEQKVQLQTLEKNAMDHSAHLRRTDQTVNVMFLTGLAAGHQGRVDNTSISPPRLTRQDHAPPPSSSPSPPSSSPPPPPPPPMPKSLDSDRRTAAVPQPPPLPRPSSTSFSGQCAAKCPTPAPPPSQIARKNPTDDTPPRYEISPELLKTVTLRPMNERRLREAKSKKTGGIPPPPPPNCPTRPTP